MHGMNTDGAPAFVAPITASNGYLRENLVVLHNHV